MRTTLRLVVMILVLSLAALAQTASVGVQPVNGNTVVMQDHPQHATQHAMASEQSLLTNTITSEHGEQPVIDFAPDPKREVPLGDVARYYRTHKYVPMR
jgi:hypothetical protein